MQLTRMVRSWSGYSESFYRELCGLFVIRFYGYFDKTKVSKNSAIRVFFGLTQTV